MIISRGAKSSCQLAGAIALVLFSLASSQAREVAPPSPTFSVLHRFAGAPNDGDGPSSALIPSGDGGYYGVTSYGGAGQGCKDSRGNAAGCGTVYELSPDGTDTILYSFTGGADGQSPSSTLARDPQGNLYGTTTYGGDLTCIYFTGTTGCGVVFKLSPDGTETVLHAFSADDGDLPNSRLLLAADGSLYGTAAYGGDPACGTYDCGVVFKLSPDGTYSKLHVFRGPDGEEPMGDLIRDHSGNFYGVTRFGGSDGWGVIFKLAPNGAFSVLHNFIGSWGHDSSGGYQPEAGLVGDPAGNLYGTTATGGTNCKHVGGCGTVFKLAPYGTYTVLHTFLGGIDGSSPSASLYRDPRTGALYGTTINGGSNCAGTVFKIEPDGNKRMLHCFGANGANGFDPQSALIEGSGAQLIGTAPYDSSSGNGTIYSLQMTQ